jgi:hypothetical protein
LESIGERRFPVFLSGFFLSRKVQMHMLEQNKPKMPFSGSSVFGEWTFKTVGARRLAARIFITVFIKRNKKEKNTFFVFYLI